MDAEIYPSIQTIFNHKEHKEHKVPSEATSANAFFFASFAPLCGYGILTRLPLLASENNYFRGCLPRK